MARSEFVHLGILEAVKALDTGHHPNKLGVTKMLCESCFFLNPTPKTRFWVLMGTGSSSSRRNVVTLKEAKDMVGLQQWRLLVR